MKLTLRFELEADDDAVALLRQFLPVAPAIAAPAEPPALATPFEAEPLPPPAEPPACVEPDPLATKLAIDLGRRPTVGELAHARRETQAPAAPPLGAEPPTTPPTESPAILPPVADLRAGTGVTVAKLNEAGNLELVEEASRVTPIRLGPAAVAELANGKARPEAHPGGSRPEGARTASKLVKPGKPATPSRQPSVNRAAAQLATNRQAAGAELSWDLFDALVRKEVDRLAPVPGQMPSHAIWNTQRDPQLPTLTTIQTRYGVGSVEALAQLLGFTPPPRGPRPASVEAAHD